MSYLEERILKIIELKQKGLDDLAVAQNLDLEPETVQLYEKSIQDSIKEVVRHESRNLSKLAEKIQISPIAFKVIANYYKIALGKPEEITMERIQEAILQGHDSPKALAQFFGINYGSAVKLQNKFGFCFMGGKYRTLLMLREAEKESLTLKETSKKTNLSSSYLRNIARHYNITLKELSAEQSDQLTRTEIKFLRNQADKKDVKDLLFYRLVRRGLTLEQIGDKLGVTRERIRQKINERGLYEHWRLSRTYYRYNERERQMETERSKLIDILNKRVQQQTDLIDESTNWAEKKATEYKLSMKKSLSANNIPRPIPYEKLVEVFRYYRESQLKEEKLSFEDISKKAGFKYRCLSKRVLNRVGLQSLNWQIEDMCRLSEKQKEMIKRSASLEMSNFDRAYFMNLPMHTPGQYGIKRTWFIIKQLSNKEKLNYRLASQIYEAQDAGFSREEIIELLDTHPKAVDYAISHRDEIAPKIIDGLNILYPQKNYIKPYLNTQ